MPAPAIHRSPSFLLGQGPGMRIGGRGGGGCSSWYRAKSASQSASQSGISYRPVLHRRVNCSSRLPNTSDRSVSVQCSVAKHARNSSDVMASSQASGWSLRSPPYPIAERLVMRDPLLSGGLGLKSKHRLMYAVRANYSNIIAICARTRDDGVGCHTAI
jgi:hypothetical protein